MGDFLWPSEIFGFTKSQTGQSHYTHYMQEKTHIYLFFFLFLHFDHCFLTGLMWPVSSGHSLWGLIPTQAAWRSWTTRWRSEEGWSVWKTSSRCWRMPSAFCHDDAPLHTPLHPHPSIHPSVWPSRCSVLLLCSVTSYVCQDRCAQVSVPYLQCATRDYDLLLEMAAWLTSTVPTIKKPQCAAQATFPKM